jgi:hypothetical protein
MLWENVRTNELVTSDTMPHVYDTEVLIVAFDSSMWIITIPQMGISGTVDSSAGKMGLVSGKKSVTNHMGVRINPAAQFQPVTHVRRFNMLHALDMVRIQSFCV